MKPTRLALSLAVLGVAGCTVQVEYDPRGADVTLQGSWYVDGAPATAASCTASGIGSVRLVFVEGSREYRYADLEWACANGAFDTRPIAVLDHGLFRAFWEADLADGSTLRTPDTFVIDTVALSTTHVMITVIPDFRVDMPPGFDPLGTDASLGATWTIDGATPTAMSCAAAGIAEVQIVFFAEADTGRTAGVEVARTECVGGAYASAGNVLAEGRYLTRVNALATGGAVVAMYDAPSPLVVDVTLNTHYDLMAVDFATTTPTTLRVNFGWDTDPTPVMMDTDCATAGVTTMNYMVTPAGTTTLYDDATGVPCEDTLDWADIPPGEYNLFVEGFISGVKTWESMACDMYVVASGIEEYNCFMNNTSMP